MEARLIRQKFLDFFVKHGHESLASSSLVPEGDSTLLFANAGMNQFKDVFTGQVTRAYSRATTSQKCVRAGGKHNDLENVGVTPRHHTFFEMLGNFSFGDYFKRDAISLAWQFLTEEMKLNKDLLWVTIHDSDDEAETLWQEISLLPKERIVRMGDKDNFWAMGDTGPCGPCSEIHMDQGTDLGPVGDFSTDRYLEIWNLVFMQFEQKADGSRSPLPKPSIDTGMGLERLAAVVGGHRSNYDTDLFVPLTSKVAEISGVAYDKAAAGIPHRILADHAKACTFLIADGILPSNEGRGYVLRRIMRRAIRSAYLLGLREAVLVQLLDTVLAIYAEAYPKLLERKTRIREVIQEEEERFLTTIEQGIQLFEKKKSQWKAQGIIPGSDAFMLYDTYGFPLDLTELMAEEEKLQVDGAGFEKCMDEQKKKARESSMFKTGEFQGLHWQVLQPGKQEFIGYEQLSVTSTILRQATTAKGQRLIVPEVCCFYAESGGQLGDQGTVTISGQVVEVMDCQLVDGYRALLLDHEVKIAAELPATLEMKVNEARRLAIAAHHTSTHLLHRALKDVIGERAEQRGSWVGPTHLRFDFPHGKAVSVDQLRQVEEKVNAWIQENQPVATGVTSLEEARSRGVTALFGEKYGDEVRVVAVGKEGEVSQELCGGTHLNSTGQALAFSIQSESSIASGIRRIEAKAGGAALAELFAKQKLLDELCLQFKAQPHEMKERLEKLMKDNQTLVKEMAALSVSSAMDKLQSSVAKPHKTGNIEYITELLSGVDAKSLRKAAEQLRQQHENLFMLIAGSGDDKLALVIALPKAAAKAGKIHAGQLMKELAPLLGGSGGGAPDFAQAGGDRAEGWAQAVEMFKAAMEKLAGN